MFLVISHATGDFPQFLRQCCKPVYIRASSSVQSIFSMLSFSVLIFFKNFFYNFCVFFAHGISLDSFSTILAFKTRTICEMLKYFSSMDLRVMNGAYFSTSANIKSIISSEICSRRSLRVKESSALFKSITHLGSSDKRFHGLREHHLGRNL